MSNIILPDDPLWREPLVMGKDANKMTPKGRAAERAQELDVKRTSESQNANFKYANSAIAHHPEPWIRTAQMAGVSNMMTQPMWFSPIHTPQNWQVASKRREIYQWCRHFYDNEPKVGAAIDFYSRFCMNGFKLECKDRKILRFFEHHVVKRLKMNEMFKMISSEYFMLGDVFVHLDVECPICNGSGVDPDTKEQCNHPGGSFKRIIILNPDWIEVQQSVLADEPSIVMLPDEELKRIVFLKQPRNIYNRIPDKIKELVIQQKPIPLSNRTVSHLRHMPVPYGTYGSSLIRRLFTTLAYKTKMMTANWIIAERLILPVRVVKVGSDDRPATSADIADIQQQLAATANDPNLTIVTHHNFEYEWYGASGKILQVTSEMEFVGKEILDGFMLNQSLLNGEMSGYQCYDQDTKVLTKEGWKRYENVTGDDEIMVFDPNKNFMFYEKPKAMYEKHYTGDMIHFSGNKVDVLVTPNHKILYYKQDKKQYFTSDAKAIYEKISNYESRDHSRVYFRSVSEWKCSNKLSKINLAGHEIPLDPFLEFAGYYLSEGYCSNGNRCSFSQSETANPEKCSDIQKFVDKLKEIPFKKYTYDNKATEWCICQKQFASQISEWFGTNSSNKKIPTFIKNLPVDKLQILIHALMNGDATKYEYKTTDAIQLGSNSYQLIEDVAEILFKMNLAPVISQYRKEKQYLLYCNMQTNGKGRMPKIKKQHAKIMHYDGKVWCFTTSTGFFVTMRNGKISIQGNSAQVGVETLIRRIESWRATLAEWAEENIFKPVAEMQGFIDEEKTEEIGETAFLYPTIKWNDLNLKDKTQWYQLLNQLHDKQLISSQTLLEEIGMDWDQEVKRQRYEQTQAGPAGGMLGQGGGGGMGMGGGGGAGGPPPDMGGGGGAPGGGMPGGDMGMGMGGMGAPGGAGGMGGMGAAAAGGKVMKKGKEPKQEQAEQMPMIKLTSIEQKMAGILTDLASAYHIDPTMNIRAQFPVENPKGGKPFPIDFAFPRLKLGVECLHPNTLVQTQNGSKKAKEVVSTDKLIGRLGDEVSIENIFKHQYDGQMVTLKAFGLAPFKVTTNHPMLACKPKKIRVKREEPAITRTRDYIVPDEPRFVEAGKLEAGDFLMIPIRSGCDDIKLDITPYQSTANGCHELPDQIPWNTDFCWLLGIYAAEGSCTSGNVEFSFNMNESELISKTQYLLNSLFGLPSRVHTDIKNNVSRVVCSCSTLSRMLLDMFGSKAHLKRLPHHLFNLHDQQKRSFLKAYCEGDGCVRSYDGAMRFISSSKSLIMDVQMLCISIAEFATLCTSRKEGTVCNIQGRDYVTKGLWEVAWHENVTKRAFRRDDNYVYIPIKSIKSETYTGTVYNFETSGEGESNHTYCVGNVISHNCDGEVWHQNPDQAAHDKERDYLLAQRGWTILRFDDKAIEEATQAVSRTISTHLKNKLENQKKASVEETGLPELYTVSNGKLIGLYSDYEKYTKGKYKFVSAGIEQ